MIKRILAIVALAAVFAACSPANDGGGGGTSPGLDGARPALPEESLPAESMAPSPS